MSRARPRVSVYIDGFNLYYGICASCGPHKQFKWLDPRQVVVKLLPRHRIKDIRYFTARVSSRDNDPDKPTRQQIYFRALRTVKDLSIYEGYFLDSLKNMRLVAPRGRQKFADVYYTEEKGSDVNLATMLLIDGYAKKYDRAIVISNDSDLVLPIKHVIENLGKEVWVVTPHLKTPSAELQQVATRFLKLWPATVTACQFPETLVDDVGEFHMPPEWAARPKN